MIDLAGAVLPSATFSPCGHYRYNLVRPVGIGIGPRALWVGHNPSYAGAEKNDPTVTRIVKFTEYFIVRKQVERDIFLDAHCGSVEIVNPFALCGTDPTDVLAEHRKRSLPYTMTDLADPVGPENDAHLRAAIARCDGPVICCWGNVHKDLRWRLLQVLDLLKGRKLFALGFTKDGFPKHPLARGKAFIPYGTPLEPFNLLRGNQ